MHTGTATCTVSFAAQCKHDRSFMAVQALLEQLAGMRLATAKDDPFGGSTVWAT